MKQRKRVRLPYVTPISLSMDDGGTPKAAREGSIPSRETKCECPRKHLVRLLRCLRSEVGSIPVGGASGSERRSQQELQIPGRRFDSFLVRRFSQGS